MSDQELCESVEFLRILRCVASIEVDCWDGYCDLGGVRFAVRFDREEHERRAGSGLGAVADRNVVRAIAALPEQEAVRVQDLRPREARVLSRLPRGVVDASSGAVTRLARSPIASAYAFVWSNSVLDGIDRFAQVPPVLPRVIILGSREGIEAGELLEAGYYGFGVAASGAVDSVDGSPLLIGPERPDGSRGPVRWTLEEQLYARLLEARNHQSG